MFVLGGFLLCHWLKLRAKFAAAFHNIKQHLIGKRISRELKLPPYLTSLAQTHR